MIVVVIMVVIVIVIVVVIVIVIVLESAPVFNECSSSIIPPSVSSIFLAMYSRQLDRLAAMQLHVKRCLTLKKKHKTQNTTKHQHI